MAEEFHTGVCSGSWWNAVRGGFEGPLPMSAAAAVSCSAAASDVGSFGWALEMMDSKARSGEESAAASVSGGSTLTFHGSPGVHPSDPVSGCGFLRMEQTSPRPVGGSRVASPSMDWSQALLSNRRIEGGFQAMLHDHLSSRSYLYQEPSLESDQAHKGMDNTANPFKDYSQEFMTHQAHLNSGGDPRDGANTGFQGAPFACSSTLLHDLLGQDMKPQTSAFDARSSTNFMSPASYRSSSGDPSRFPHFLKSSPLKQQQPSSTDHLQFSSDAQFWNASTPTQFFTQQAFEEKPSHSTTTRGKPSSEGARDSSPASTAKKSATNEPAFKKPRIETPSPLPTFKVRKEKLGDRITALQQLVSPFGKTDTASVLHEAIEYINFLHEQVGALSTPYLKNGPAMQHHQHQKSENSKVDGECPKQDLRSRGLCLVPISATFPVVNEPTTADFWTPTFGGTYR